MIPRLQYVEFTETKSTSTTYADFSNVLVDGNFVYLIFHYNGTGGPSYLIRFNLTDNTYESLYLGSGFTASAPIIKYDSTHMVTAIMLSNFTTVRFIVIDLSTLTISNSFSIDHGQNPGSYAQSRDLFKRTDGGLVYHFYTKRNFAYSYRHSYIMNVTVNDLLAGDVVKDNVFDLGTVGRIVKSSNGIYLYHPNQNNAVINKDNFRFLLYSDDDTLHNFYYYDGTPAPIPFTPNVVDYSKVNSYVNVWHMPKIYSPFINNEYYITGNDIYNNAAFEIDDTSFIPVNHKATAYPGSLYFFGDTINLLLWKTDETAYIYKITDGSTNQLADILLYYKYAIFPMTYDNKFYVFGVHDIGSYVVGGVSIYSLEDIGIVPEFTGKMYPFWLRGGER